MSPSSPLLPSLVGLCFVLTPAAAAADDPPRFAIELEAGAAWQERNDVQIPNDESGDRFSLRDLTGVGPWPAARLELAWDVRGRHSLRFLAAPLSFTETGALDGPVRFAGAAFDAGVPTKATYRFNSWRATYRYRIHEGERSRWWIGATAKIRDAEIRLEQGSTVGAKTDLGFVPLFYLKGDWRFAGRWRLFVDFDGLAGGPGRAIDLGVKAGRDIGERWSIAAGYRTVEGGADVDEVYNFAWFHYAVVSATVRF